MKRPRRVTRRKLESLIADVAAGLSIDDIAARLDELGVKSDRPVAEALRDVCARLATPETPALLASLIGDLFRSPSPDGALINFHRYLDASGASSAFLNTVAGGRPIREILATVFGSSQYMSDIVIRNPGYVYWLMEKATLEQEVTEESLERALRADTDKFSTLDGRLNAARRFHRRMLLRIGVKDLLGERKLEETTAELSVLADVLVGSVLGLVWDDTAGDDDPAPGDGLAVLAMGKLGGRELNYSSDIDLVYVCDDREDETLEFYKRVATRLTSALSSLTPEGYLYRVDLRLRPDGDTGPLVNSLAAMQIYYENRARPWELQAMLKARTIAGDLAVGKRFHDGVMALTFHPTQAYSPIDTVSLMRKQIRANMSAPERALNIKLMEGGIRDIEFIAQTLQLLHGRTHKILRTQNTLAGVRAARRLGLLAPIEARALENAYNFFRVVEHRLQMMHQIKTHSVPETDHEMHLLAGRVSRGPLGKFTFGKFRKTLTNHLTKVRIISDRFFDDEDVPDAALILLAQDERAAAPTLARYGIADARQSTAILQKLAYGSFPNLLDRGARAAFQRLIPLLLEELSRTGQPGTSLVNFANLAESSRNQRALYEYLLASPPARAFIRDLAGSAAVLCRTLARRLSALDTLLTDPRVLLETPLRDEAAWQQLVARSGRGDRVNVSDLHRQIRDTIDARLLAAWVIDILDKRLPDTLMETLTTSTRELVVETFDAVVNDPKRVALFAMGSFAVGEARPSSDVDLLAVTDDTDLENATRDVQRLHGLLGGLLRIDFRLRGEGASAPLVQSLDFYDSYFETRMSPWERVAYAKCAHWAGSPAIAARFLERLREAVLLAPSPETLHALRATRGKLEGLVTGKPLLETKRSAGGRYDVEYLCAVGMGHFGTGRSEGVSRRDATSPRDGVDDVGDRPETLHLDLCGDARLRVLRDAGVVTEDEARGLYEATQLYGRLDYLLELHGLSVPSDPARESDLIAYLDRTCEMLRIPVQGGIAAALRMAKATVRACYERIVELDSTHGDAD